ncbi:hypothetical protein OROHE_018903 [Orobanche hederae]
MSLLHYGYNDLLGICSKCRICPMHREPLEQMGPWMGHQTSYSGCCGRFWFRLGVYLGCMVRKDERTRLRVDISTANAFCGFLFLEEKLHLGIF